MGKSAMNLICLGLSFLMYLVRIDAYVPGDRVSTLCQTSHGGFKSPWMDLNLMQMPKFGWPSSSIVQTNLPRPKENEPEMRLNPNEDVKISLTFSRHKLVVPWILLYDAKHKKSLVTLVVTFAHDDFEVISLRYEAIYGPPIARLDPQHPSLTAFDMVYQWEAVHDSDLRMGVVVMFIATLIVLTALTCFVTFTYSRNIMPPVKPHARASGRNSGRDQYSGGGGYSSHRN